MPAKRGATKHSGLLSQRPPRSLHAGLSSDCRPVVPGDSRPQPLPVACLSRDPPGSTRSFSSSLCSHPPRPLTFSPLNAARHPRRLPCIRPSTTRLPPSPLFAGKWESPEERVSPSLSPPRTPGGFRISGISRAAGSLPSLQVCIMPPLVTASSGPRSDMSRTLSRLAWTC